MLEFEMNKQSERRGRFLIQEIEEEPDATQVQVVKLNHCSERASKVIPNRDAQIIMNNSKKTKHSSIIMDSKIIHTTRMDSNFYNEAFSAFIYADNHWVDFELIWKEFSKHHVDVMEDDMEKIFHYIDTKIDESDFSCFLHSLEPCPILNKLEGKQKGVSDNEIRYIIDERDFKAVDRMEDFNNKITCSNLIPSASMSKEFNLKFANVCKPDTQKKNYKKESNRSLILTNFHCPSIVSPPVSPIDSRAKLNNLYVLENIDNDIDEESKTHNKIGSLTSLRFDQNKRHLINSEKLAKRTKTFTEVKDNFISEINSDKSFILKKSLCKIVKVIQFSLAGKNDYKDKDGGENNNLGAKTKLKIESNFQFSRVSQETFIIDQSTDNEKICAICKNKVN